MKESNPTYTTIRFGRNKTFSGNGVDQPRDNSGKFGKTEDLNSKCRFCGSTNVVKFGYNITKEVKKQRYKCKDCNAKFTPSEKLVKQNKFSQNSDKDVQQAKDKKLGKFCRMIKDTVYPFLDFKLHYTAKYDTSNFLDLLTHVAMNQDFTENGSKTFRFVMREQTPSADALLYHINSKFTPEEIKEMFSKAFDRIFDIAEQNNIFKRRKFDVAIDLTDCPYYGDKNDPMVVGSKFQRGTAYAYRFATIAIVVDGRRFTLLTLPMSQFESNAKIVKELISYANKKIRIRTVYLDRGFNSVGVINTMERLGVKYLMPLQILARKRRKLVEESEPNTVLDYTMRSTQKARSRIKVQATFKFCIVKSTKSPGKKVAFATNLDVNERNVEAICNRYGKRWGIETSYRVQDNLLPKTTSKNYIVRLFYFLFSVCLYNLWILANIVVGLLILKFIPNKPFITAKTFGVMLYTLGSKLFDPGG